MSSCSSGHENRRPNVILIMADDMGYECLSTYGSLSYQTPVLDSLAAHGIRFEQAVSQPLCTPSRVKIMTGLYNYRNYDYFGHLQNEAYTFGNLMKEAGYATCIAGKWQLNGLAYKEELTHWNDANRPHHFGFDEYSLWQLTKSRGEGERYANPLIEQNGQVLENVEDSYGPDIFADFILDYIERKKDSSFFIYYPMVLVHDPFVPTPDSEKWENEEMRYQNDTAYFKDMVAYTDKIVGRIVHKLRELELDENTILIFTGDNGTHPTISTKTEERLVRGGKGNTIDAGTHVPLIAYWPEKIREGLVYENLIEFSDFFPTLAELVGKQVKADGKSFYPLLSGQAQQARENAFVHYDPRWGENVNQHRNQFVRTLDYKLYQDGNFYNLKQDILEENPLSAANLSEEEKRIKASLEDELNKHPAWNIVSERK
ncbi:sulfatase-like hydrolase/transferase [Catalinimonas sp. 4WD22]|uniref:sulfatase-like hydrolase/transferase n=1 Tax=Catalinimonas locisalis TaxID=3133978 RepID=UPI003100BFE6